MACGISLKHGVKLPLSSGLFVITKTPAALREREREKGSQHRDEIEANLLFFCCIFSFGSRAAIKGNQRASPPPKRKKEVGRVVLLVSSEHLTTTSAGDRRTVKRRRWPPTHTTSQLLGKKKKKKPIDFKSKSD